MSYRWEKLSSHYFVKFLKLNDSSDIRTDCNNLGSPVDSLGLDLNVAPWMSRLEDCLELVALFLRVHAKHILP